MTIAADLRATGETTLEPIDLDPGVPAPPFPVWLCLPSAWSRLDSNPTTWRVSADRLIDNSFRGTRLPAAQRRAIIGMLEGLVADCQRAGAALSLLTVGRRAAGGAASFGLHLAFAADDRPASLGRVHDSRPRTGLTSELSTRSGPAVMHRDRATMVVPGSAEIVALTSIQIFVPIPDTRWTVLLSTASAFPELTEPLAGVARAVAESICINDPAASADAPAPDPADAGDADWIRIQSDPAAPGFERGFGTLVARRIDPAPADRPDRERQR